MSNVVVCACSGRVLLETRNDGMNVLQLKLKLHEEDPSLVRSRFAVKLLCGESVLQDAEMLQDLAKPELTCVPVSFDNWSQEDKEKLLKIVEAAEGAQNDAHLELERLMSKPLTANTLEGRLALRHFAGRGNLPFLDSLLDALADANEKDGNQSYALSIACGCGRMQVVERLVEKRANLNKQGDEALLSALNAKQGEVVRFLLTNAQMQRAVRLFWRSTDHWVDNSTQQSSYSEAVELLVAGSADVNQVDRDVNKKDVTFETTPLSSAVRSGKVEAVRCLFKAHADLNKESGLNSLSPLMVASGLGHMQVVKFLLEARANVNQVTGSTGYQNCALNHSCLHLRVEVVRFLLEARADVTNWGPACQRAALKGLCRRVHKSLKWLIRAKAHADVAQRNPSDLNYAQKALCKEVYDSLLAARVELTGDGPVGLPGAGKQFCRRVAESFSALETQVEPTADNPADELRQAKGSFSEIMTSLKEFGCPTEYEPRKMRAVTQRYQD